MQLSTSSNIVCTPHPFLPGEEGGLSIQWNFQKEGNLTESQFLEGIARKERGDFFRWGGGGGGVGFLKKKKKKI